MSSSSGNSKTMRGRNKKPSPKISISSGLQKPRRSPREMRIDRGKQNLQKMQARAGSYDHGPVVGISHRPGHGYDLHAVRSTMPNVIATSSPPNLQAPDRKASKGQIRKNEDIATQTKRAMIGTEHIAQHLKNLDGIYIPGGQDIPNDVHQSREVRLQYEAELVRGARERGIPVLAICGGSRRLAQGYGVNEVDLSSPTLEMHNRSGTQTMAHSLSMPDPNTILGGNRITGKRQSQVDTINSTHSKVVETEPEPVQFPWSVPKLKGVDTVSSPDRVRFQFGSFVPEPSYSPLLSVTAIEPKHRTVEGFESTFGAPHIGVTSHPEAIAGGSSKAVKSASKDGTQWSKHVMRAFEQSTQTYQRRRLVNAQIKGELPKSYKQDQRDLTALKLIDRGTKV